MRENARRITIGITLVVAFATFPLFAAAYMKVEGIKGQATAAGHEKWIELGSVQFVVPPSGATVGSDPGSPACRKAKTAEATTNIKKLYDGARSTEPDPLERQLQQLCSTGAPVPTVLLDIDGQLHTLRNASLRGCQSTSAGDSTRLKFTLSFSECATHAETGTANATLTGFAPTSQEVQLQKLDFASPTRATIQFYGTGVYKNSDAPASTTPHTMTIDLKTGTRWVLKDALVASAQPSSTGRGSIYTITFGSMEGPSSGFHPTPGQ